MQMLGSKDEGGNATTQRQDHKPDEQKTSGFDDSDSIPF
jgi:hypothetical protein